MCGIFAILGNENNYKYYNDDLTLVRNSFMLGKNRGPDYHVLYNGIEDYHVLQDGKDSILPILLGFHRLSINGLDKDSNQPICINKKTLICNGEIYNYKELYEKHGIIPKTNSDCEVIIHMYERYGIEGTLQILDGVFAFILIDNMNPQTSLFVGRDPYGVRPLFSGVLHKFDTTAGNMQYMPIFASEKKMILGIENDIYKVESITQFLPGHYCKYEFNRIEQTWNCSELSINKSLKIHNLISFSTPMSIMDIAIHNEEDALEKIHVSLREAVKKRVYNTEREIACLLSGGLDSSLITSIVNFYYKEKNQKSGFYKPLETYSIGMEGSEDLKYARIVAEYLETKHTEIILSEKEFLDAIPNVIYAIESYDTTTVRASVGNYLVSKYISENSGAKVIFNGDGSDEVAGGYMYFHCASNAYEFDFECKRLLKDICYFDVLRSDRSISSNGLEARTPFLDKGFVQTYLSISKQLRWDVHKKYCEKYLIRKAFDVPNDSNATTWLPKEVLWRTKEAFSDGVSSHHRSWYQIIQEYVKTIDVNHDISYEYNVPKTDEQKYYRSLYETYFGNKFANTIPYFWMPRFVIGATDASARTLDIYKDKIKQ